MVVAPCDVFPRLVPAGAQLLVNPGPAPEIYTWKQVKKLAGMCSQRPANRSISFEMVLDMFLRMETRQGWDFSKPMLWGYYFTNAEAKPLERARDRLVRGGYRFVDLHQSEKEAAGDPNEWWLHVEKEEVHSPMSLDNRNDDLYRIALEFGLASYDGMDVGPIVGP